MKLELEGLRVVVTAAAAGIGRATARMFADHGADVWVCDVDAPALTEVCRHERIDGHVADVGDTDSIDRFMTEALTALGGIEGAATAVVAIVTAGSAADCRREPTETRVPAAVAPATIQPTTSDSIMRPPRRR